MSYSTITKEEEIEFRRHLKKRKAELDKFKKLTLFERRLELLKKGSISFKEAKGKNWKKFDKMREILRTFL